MDAYYDEEFQEDYSYSELDSFPDFILERSNEIKDLKLDHNQIPVLPRSIGRFTSLVSLDISNNNLSYISSDIALCQNLRILLAKNNNIETDGLPKELSLLRGLEVLNLAGNSLSEMPSFLTELNRLKVMYLGGNYIEHMPAEIRNMKSLEILYAGGNRLEEVPIELGLLSQLKALNLCDNKLLTLPATISHLRNLKSLCLHNNQLSTLPPEIVTLNLVELSLRNNPLIHRFVQDMTYEPPSLLELAGRAVKVKKVMYTPVELPVNLYEYLRSAQHCVNPKCKGVYFSSKVEHVKFVDFCGKYRVPLLEYLCSPGCKVSPAICVSSSESDSEEEFPVTVKMKKVLLG